MANYKLITASPTTANTSFKAFTAGGTNTVVSSIVAVDSATSTLEALVKKSGSSTVVEVAHAQVQVDKPQELLTAPLALEASDELYVRTSRAGAKFVISYVEESKIANGTAISGLTDVDTTGVVDGDALVYNATNSQWEPGAGGGGASAMNDLTDVNAPSPLDNQVLSWDSATSKWMTDGRLTTLYANFKEGASTTLTDGANVNSRMELTNTTASLKTGVTEVKMTETSPGEIDLIVAAGAAGSETSFTAVEVNGTTAANTALVDVKDGARLRLESATNNFATVRNTATADTVITLPSSNGMLATTGDLYTNADADARIAAASVTDLTDVTSAGSGAIITTAERSKLAGISAGAEVNTVNSVNTQTGAVVLDADDISDAATTNKFTTAADISKLAGIAAGAEANVNADWNAVSGDAQILNKPTLATVATTGAYSDLSGTPSLATVATTGAYSDLTGTPQPYEEDELVAGQNITMNTGVSVASNKVVDIMGDALADKSNANSKKMLGFHTGSGVCVLQGMVDANSSISGVTAGDPLYLGASGAFSATPTTTSTEYSRVIGYYVGTLVGGEVMCYFDPSKDWVEIS